ncbi:MAG: PaaI family thioesterase [Candidatus Dormibacteria bacterium]
MTDGEGPVLDPQWLNDRSEFQQSFVHGLKNPIGLQIQYELRENVVWGMWTPSEKHVGFPGVVHGGLIAAVLDDVMGRYAALLHIWAVTARLDVQYRKPLLVSTPVYIVGQADRIDRRRYHASSYIESQDGTHHAQATGVYLTLSKDLMKRTVEAWPGFAEYLPE